MDESTKLQLMPAEQVVEVSASSNIFPKEAVEGVLAEFLSQLKASVDVVVAGSEVSSLTRYDSARSCYIIAGQEVESILHLLEAYSNAALTVKHRYCRAVLREFLDKLYDIKVLDAKSIRNKVFLSFARELVEFMTVFHVTLSDKTSDKKRAAFVMEYCGQLPMANGDLH
tara:strand:+ start:908 stop:1417 length:510 start_codon:yes stop_codon:yes gene_type:complete